MALPGVSVNITNGNLGRVAGTVDSVCGLLLTGAAVASVLTLGTPYQIFSPDDANLLGLNAAYDVTNATNAYRHIVDFYSVAPLGTELWIMVISPTNTLKDMADPTKLFAKVLLDAGRGRIKMLGLTRNPASSYAPVITEGIDPDTVLAIPAAHILAESFAAAYAPVRVLVEGRDFSGTVADLRNLRQNAHNRVGVVLAGLGAGLKAAAVGLALGKFAANPVQRNIGRVKDGPVPGVQAYLSNGQPMSSFSMGQQTILHDKGYIFLRNYPNLNGFYFNDDCACCPLTDDYSSLARGRVIDKAKVITYQTYTNEILDDVEIDEAGHLEAAVAKGYQAQIERAIYLTMQVNGEISGVQASVNPLQNVLATDQIKIRLDIRPKGYAKFISVELGFINPAAN